MNLPNDLISRFVKVTKDDKKNKSETIVYGTTVESNGKMYVKIDGSEELTPVVATADTVVGERVIVMIKNHTATITGNITSPAARIGDIEDTKTAVNTTIKTVSSVISVDSENGLQLGNKISGIWNGFRIQLTETVFNVINAIGSILMSVGDELITIGNENTDVKIKNVSFGNTDISEIGDGSVTGAIGELNSTTIKYKKETFTLTTSSVGICYTTMLDDKYTILSAFSVGAIVIPFSASNGYKGLALYKASTSGISPIVNTECTIDVVYIEES